MPDFRLFLCCLLIGGVIGGCFTADEEPADEEVGDSSDDDTEGDDTMGDDADDSGDDVLDDDSVDDDTAQDDDSVDDDSDDDSIDDDSADDDSDDDADDDATDDDASDDDTAAAPDCAGITSVVYNDCGDDFAWKSAPGDRLNIAEALDECESGGDFWTCVQVCVDENASDCDGLGVCVNDCEGDLYYENLN
jgi:hypothetical protein